MEDKWIKDIKDRLGDHEMKVPDGLWEAVNPNPGVATDKARRLTFHRLLTAAAAAAAIIVAAVALHFAGNDAALDLRSPDGVSLSQRIDRPRNNRNMTDNASENIAGIPDKAIKTNGARNGNNVNRGGHDGDDRHASDVMTSSDNDETAAADNATADGNSEEEGSDTLKNREQTVRLSLLGDHDDKLPTAKKRKAGNVRKRSSSGKISFGVVTSAGSFGYEVDSDAALFWNPSVDNPGGNSSPGTDGPGAAPGDSNNPPVTDGTGTNPGNGNGNNGGDDYSYGDGDEDDGDEDDENGNHGGHRVPRKSSADNNSIPDDNTDEITHHMPIKLGFSFLYRLSDKFGVETGLVYTYLSSDIKYVKGFNAKFVDGTQSLHYIGIPVNVKYRPAHWRWADIYVSGGFLFDKCVSSSVKGRYASPISALYSSERISLGERPFQISANISVGLQFNITPSLGIYAEPGVSHYFNDGSSLSTYYKEHPWNFNINAGIRLSIGY